MSKAADSPLGEVLEGFKSRSYDVHEFKGVPVNVYLFAEEVEPSGLMGDPTKASAKNGESLYLKAMDFIDDFVEAFRKLSPNVR
jgi:creatinine amidohydrolase/Fe(II)-dependent formamide hydrolase-like protein